MQLPAPGDELVAQLRIAAAVADVPLAGGDDLERPVAPLVELDRVGDRLRVADQLAGVAEQLDDTPLGLADRLPGELGVRGAAGVAGDDVGWVGLEATVPVDDRSGRQVQLAPPGDVGEVTEGADHRDAGALLGIGEPVRDDGDLDVEERRAHRRSEQRLVAGVVGMGDEGDAGGDQLRSGRLDDDRRRRRTGGTAPRGRRRASRGLRARLGPPRCGSRRPTAWAPRPGTPRPGPAGAGSRVGRSVGWPSRSWCR